MSKGYFMQGFITGILAVAFLNAAILINISKKPSAMDVYQGKTALEITYKDGIPMDSVVVFKD